MKYFKVFKGQRDGLGYLWTGVAFNDNMPANCFDVSDVGSIKDDKLKDGKWILFFWGPWSATDVKASESFVDSLCGFDDNFSVGFKVINGVKNELSDFSPDLQGFFSTPFLLFLNDGILANKITGISTKEEFESAIKENIL